MSEKELEDKIDKVLDILSKSVNKDILTTLTGVDPGKFAGEIKSEKGETHDNKD